MERELGKEKVQSDLSKNNQNWFLLFGLGDVYEPHYTDEIEAHFSDTKAFAIHMESKAWIDFC